MNHKEHWEKVYETKQPNEVSWTQACPQTSLDFIRSARLDKTAKIIDIGGGDSNLVDFLLEEGYQNISVLDISAKALARAKERLGERAHQVTWIVADIADFQPTETYDYWHDRAAFHFLTTKNQIEQYINTVKAKVSGYLTLGTFSENGPKKCSGLDICQYNESSLSSGFEPDFEKIICRTEDHLTPFGTTQNFIFCHFKKAL